MVVGNPGPVPPDLADAGTGARIHFRGGRSYREVAEELRRCRALVLFSETETFSCVTAEALCCGIPVIAPAVGALPELLDETNGIVSPNSPEGLEAAMLHVLEHPEAFDGPAIARAAAARFGYGPVAEAFDRLYRHYTV